MAKWDNFWQEKENETTEIKKEPLRETIAEDKLQEIRQIRRQLAAEAKKQEELKEKRLQECWISWLDSREEIILL